jgi:hypothetical protein
MKGIAMCPKCRLLARKAQNCPFRHGNCEVYTRIPSSIEEENS